MDKIIQAHERSQNNANRPKQTNNTSGFKGVFKRRFKWVAQIRFMRKTIYIGIFDNPEQAHIAYKEKAKELFGEFSHE